MLEYLGLDATIAFQGVGHSPDAIEMMEDYLIGILPKSERAYNNGDGWTTKYKLISVTSKQFPCYNLSNHIIV